MKDKNVTITSPWKYVSPCFVGLKGIVVREFESGCNIFLPDMNGAGTYQQQIFYFPFGTFELTPVS